MKTFILSCDDSRFESVLKRLPESIQEVERVCVTPDTVGEVPSWFEAPVDRWCITKATTTALERALECDDDCLYFEDDAIFREDFEKWFPRLIEDLPENWDQLFIGGQIGLDSVGPRQVPTTPLLLEASCVHRNHAVLTNKKSLKRVIDWYLTNEGWGSHHTCDWRLLYLHRKNDFHVYIPSMGWLVGQGGGESILDHVKYPDRWWDFTMPEIYLHSEVDGVL